MKCNDCGKEMKGGFGIGEKPFSKWHCADCAIRQNENAQNKWCLDKIISMIDEPILATGRNYKAQNMQHWDKLQKIKLLAKLVVEGK